MSFAGGFTLGMVQAGFQLAGKREMKGGFGVRNCDVNRHLLGTDWQAEACDPKDWSPVSADVVFGNPPCSGFSVMSHKSFRGADSPINECMWNFMHYVAKVKPLVAVFESVQMARTRPDGLALMRQLRDRLEELTEERWGLYHVRHNAYCVGGAAVRRRYFWVVSRIPFGVEPLTPRRLPRLNDVIGDLAPLGDSWWQQPYRSPATWWSSSRRSPSGQVDGQVTVKAPITQRISDLLDGAEWNPKEHAQVVARRYHEAHGSLPISWAATQGKLVDRDFFMGFTTPTRWAGTEPGRVITGGSLLTVLHPWLPRVITHREAARILGFPDDWRISPLRGTSGLNMTWGKGITVDCGRWIGEWIHRALDGQPGEHTGVPLGDREWDIDHTNSWKSFANLV
jgi:DNA (cytosine-5)-methyltransferase 1